MTPATAPNGAGSSETAGPSPTGVAGLVYERIVSLAADYERAGDQLAASAAELGSGRAPEWRGRAADAYRGQLDRLMSDLRDTGDSYRNVATELRVAAAGLSAQIGAAEQFLDLVSLGASVLGVLAQSGHTVQPQGRPGAWS